MQQDLCEMAGPSFNVSVCAPAAYAFSLIPKVTNSSEQRQQHCEPHVAVNVAASVLDEC
jgi:hypothetical protein